MSDEVEILLGSMYNWKMTTAYENASHSYDPFPAEVLDLLKDMSEKYGDCGWQQGTVYDELQKTNDKIADILGYRWDDKEDFYILK